MSPVFIPDLLAEVEVPEKREPAADLAATIGPTVRGSIVATCPPTSL